VRWERLGEAIGSLVQLRREQSSASRQGVARERWEAEQRTAKAKAEASTELYYVYDLLRQQNLLAMVEGVSPLRQAAAVQLLQRHVEQRRKQAASHSPATSGSFKADQGRSSHADAVTPTESDLIQPNQTQCANAPLDKKQGAI
jgi:hypothetical protein